MNRPGAGGLPRFEAGPYQIGQPKQGVQRMRVGQTGGFPDTKPPRAVFCHRLFRAVPGQQQKTSMAPLQPQPLNQPGPAVAGIQTSQNKMLFLVRRIADPPGPFRGPRNRRFGLRRKHKRTGVCRSLRRVQPLSRNRSETRMRFPLHGSGPGRSGRKNRWPATLSCKLAWGSFPVGSGSVARCSAKVCPPGLPW